MIKTKNQEIITKDLKTLKTTLINSGLLKVYIRTYGCQLNLSDSEKIKSIFLQAGCLFVDSFHEADIVVINTCAVRETAELRVFGHLGQLKEYFTKNRDKILMIGGCMVEQSHIEEKILDSYPFVGVIFNTNNISNIPSLIIERIKDNKRTAVDRSGEYNVDETLTAEREQTYRALIPVMYGCDNFCTYCSVPYVRGPERSRRSKDIKEEFDKAIAENFHEVMLLGQNVNSYGKKLEDEDINFAKLLRLLCTNKEDYRIRFMTSHPKDAKTDFFDVIAENEKISKTIHLPVQSGSNRILEKMNRNYTHEQYISLVQKTKQRIPNINFTSDIIIGFPGETEKDFLDTVSLVKEAQFYSLFIFIYSKREGTKAALMEDTTSHEEKVRRLTELTDIQNEISFNHDKAIIGTTQKAIATKHISNDKTEFRLDNNSTIEIDGIYKIGEFNNIKPTEIKSRRLSGIII